MGPVLQHGPGAYATKNAFNSQRMIGRFLVLMRCYMDSMGELDLIATLSDHKPQLSSHLSSTSVTA